jgi:hypothetical protein
VVHKVKEECAVVNDLAEQHQFIDDEFCGMCLCVADERIVKVGE